jgi:signal transduction histidine kinase/CheY-like chemotaxis protein
MSKEPSQNLSRKRLETLFADLEYEQEKLASPSREISLSGWTWECDQELKYVSCSGNVLGILGYYPHELIGKSVITCALTENSSRRFRSALAKQVGEVEIHLEYLSKTGTKLHANVHLHSIHSPNGNGAFWRGYSVLSPLEEDTRPIPPGEVPEQESPEHPHPGGSHLHDEQVGYRKSSGYQIDENNLRPSRAPLTELGVESLHSRKPIIKNAIHKDPALMAIPAQLEDVDSHLLLEIIDQDSQRSWSEHDRLLVEQVADQLTLALENARLFEQTQNALAETGERARELAILNEMSRAFTAHLDVDSLVENIYQYTSQLMDTSNFFVALHHPQEEQVTFHNVISNGQIVDQDHPEWEYVGTPQPLGGLTGHVILTREPLFVSENVRGTLEGEGIDYVEVVPSHVKTWLGVPMIVSGQVIGVVAVQSETNPDLYNHRHLNLLTAIANHAAIAIQNARLLESTRRSNEELVALNAVASAASQSLELDEILKASLVQVLKTMGFDAGLVSMMDLKDGTLKLFNHVGLPEMLQEKLQSDGLRGSLCDLVYKHASSIYLDDLSKDPPVDTSGLIAMGFHSYLGVPIETKGKTLGTICAFGRSIRTTSSADLRLMISIGQQLGVAVENAQLFEQTELALAETERLYQASARLNSAQTYEDILDALCEHTILGQADSNVTIDLFEKPWIGDQKPEWGNVLARRNPLSSQIFKTRYRLETLSNVENYLHPDRATTIFDVSIDQRLDETARSILIDSFNAKSTIFIPLVAGGQWIGFVHGIFKKYMHFQESDIRGATTLVSQAASAIQNIGLLEESRRIAGQLQTAAEIAKDTSGTLALDALLARAVNLLRDRFGFYHASIFLIEETGKRAVIRESTGIAGEEMKRRGHQLEVGSKSVVGQVTGMGEPLVVNDVLTNPIHRKNPWLPETRAEACIPMKIGERVIGALDVQSTQVNAFKPDDISVLLTLADQIAVAVENARAYELSQQAIKDMKHADQLKSQFLANMSHELRTPLNSIIGFSRVILKEIDGPVTDSQKQDLTAIYNSGHHLLNLINDILDLSKIEAGKMELSFDRDVNLSELINSVMPTVTGLVKGKPIELQKDVAEDLPLVQADPLKIRQVLINLLSNAAKFTDEGFIRVEACRGANTLGEPTVTVKVVDSGQGIAPDDKQKLFKPFSQVDASPTRKSGGTGLGLSICRHLIDMHGGQIGVESLLNRGSSFYFTIPIKQPLFRSKTNEDNQPEEVVVLSIDDEAGVLDLYQRYLEGLGYAVVPLTDPLKAVETARRLKPMVITLDIMIPGLDGWQILEDIKSDPEIGDTPVIICSVLENQEKGIKLGAADYLLKPILQADLVNAIERLNGKQ